MKFKWSNGGLKITPTKSSILTMREMKQAKEDLNNCMARQRHLNFKIRRRR